MALFKTTAEMQGFVRMSSNMKYDSMLPSLSAAQTKYLRKYLGATQLESLQDYYDTTPVTPDAALAALLPYAQEVEVKFAIYIAVPELDLTLTDSGFAITSNQNLAPASKDRVQAYRDAMLQSAYDSVENLLRFLEENADDYDEWVAGEGYSMATELFINSAEMFDKYVPIDQSRLKFQELRQHIKNVESLTIEPYISKAMCDDIKTEVNAGSVSSKYTEACKTGTMLENIRRAVANLAAFEAGMGDRFKGLGTAFMEDVKLHIDAEPTTYTLYAASDSYDADIAEDENRERFENSADSTIFNMGGF